MQWGVRGYSRPIDREDVSVLAREGDQLPRLRVINGPGGNQARRQQRKGTDTLEISRQTSNLISCRADLNGSRVNPGGLKNGLVDFRLGSARHTTIGMRHDEDSMHVEQMRGEDQCAEDVVGDPRASITNDLDVTWLHAEDGQRFDSRVHACDDGQTLQRLAGEFLMSEGRHETLIGIQNIEKHVVGKFRRFIAV